MIKLFKLHHRGAYHIGIKCPLSYDDKTVLKNHMELRFSKTNRCWYVPYSKKSFLLIKKSNIIYSIEENFGTIGVLPPKNANSDIEISVNTGASNSAIPQREVTKEADISEVGALGRVQIQWHGNQFWIKLAYNQDDVDFLKNLKSSYWNPDLKKWVVRSNFLNLKKLQAYFSCWEKTDYQRIYKLIGMKEAPQTLHIFCTPQHPKKAIIKLEGFQTDPSEIKRIPGRRYDKEFKRWIIDRNVENIKRLSDYYEQSGAKVINRLPKEQKHHKKLLPKNTDRLKFLLKKIPPANKPIISRYSEMLLRQNYSWKTISSYCGKLLAFIKFIPTIDLNDRVSSDVQDYLSHLAKSDASMSLINQSYSALLLYYQKLEFREDFQIEKLKRPRKHKYLPTILSIQEVDRLLRTTKNFKHLAILYSIYGGGLRLSEVLNLQVADIHWDRDQVLVKQGKGKKDRMVPLSQTLKRLLALYFDEYQPQYWLFEGADRNTQYSSSSIQKIVRQAAQQANISRRVTPHTLRHCFATHLLDQGTDVRYIQELLGHKDIKTTLIYTHVTNKSMNKISSPLDRLNSVKIEFENRNE